MTNSRINKQHNDCCNFAIYSDQFCELVGEQQVMLKFNSIPEVTYGK